MQLQAGNTDGKEPIKKAGMRGSLHWGEKDGFGVLLFL